MTASPWRPDPPAANPPMFNLTPMVKRLAIVTVALHIIRIVLPPEWQQLWILNFGFVPAYYTVADRFLIPAVLAPITHQFVHGGFLHLGLNMVMLVAFGTGVERTLGGRRMLLFYLVCGIFGAAFHLVVYPTSVVPVVGASGAISGLFGGILRLVAVRARQMGRVVRLLPAAAVWIGLALMTGFIGMPGTGGASVAWAAHVGGFLAGLALFGFFVPRYDRRPPPSP
ncbi:MAG: rhomboid family intramembrane serine protease [Rhodospirillaceae bacterium]|nr:rhomboid family intramembrane serine protease [Rhodospirillaceae bacterium]